MGKSNNRHYRSEDLKRPFDNIKEAMGLTGNADSNYYTNLGKISRYEGSELDNRGKRGTLDALSEVLATMMGPGFEKDRYQANLGLTGKAENYAESRTTDDLRPDLVRKGGFQADQAGSEAGVAGLLAGLAEQIAKHGVPDIADYDTSNPNEMRPYEDAVRQSAEGFEDIIRKYGAIKGGKGRDAHKTAEQQAGVVKSTIDTKEAQTSWYEERKKYVGLLGDKNVALVEERINSLKGLTDIRKKKIINDILNDVAELDQKILTERGKRLTEAERTKLVQERLLVAQQNLKKAGAEAEVAELEKDFKGGELYRLEQKQWQELERLKLQVSKEKNLVKKAELEALLAEKTQQYKITKAKNLAAKSGSDASKSKSNADIADQNQKAHAQKLLDLQTTRTNIIDRGKVALKKANTESDRADIKLRIEKELEPVNIAIKKMALTNAEAALQSKEANTYKTMVTTPNPNDLKRKRENLEARTNASKKSGGGGISTEELINQQIKGGGTSTTRGISTPASKKGLPPSPEAQSVLKELMAVPPNQLLGWNKDDIEKAVVMIQTKFPKMHPERIRRLIGIQQNRSK
jgi:hypothetical protein